MVYSIKQSSVHKMKLLAIFYKHGAKIVERGFFSKKYITDFRAT